MTGLPELVVTINVRWWVKPYVALLGLVALVAPWLLNPEAELVFITRFGVKVSV